MLTALQQVERIARSPRRGAVTSGGRGIVVGGRRRAVLRLSPRSEITTIKEGISRDEPTRSRHAHSRARARAHTRSIDVFRSSAVSRASAREIDESRHYVPRCSRRRFSSTRGPPLSSRVAGGTTFRKLGIIFLSSSEDHAGTTNRYRDRWMNLYSGLPASLLPPHVRPS